jgi:uncharacterized membrane protein YbaN (DUF454 family)
VQAFTCSRKATIICMMTFAMNTSVWDSHHSTNCRELLSAALSLSIVLIQDTNHLILYSQ